MTQSLEPMTPQGGAAALAPEAAEPSKRWTELAFKLGPLAGLVLLMVAFSVLSPFFLTTGTFANIGRQVATNSFLSLGLLVVILTAGIDLSVGALMALCMSVLAMLVVKVGLPEIVAIPGTLLLGIGLGMLNGLLLTRLHLPHPFISTLGMMNVARGVALVITGASPIFGFSAGFITTLGGQDIKLPGAGAGDPGLPFVVILIVLAYFAFHVFLTRTVVGRQIYAVGGNPEAARLSGVPVNRILVLVYTLSGLMAAIAAIVLAGRTNSGYPTAGMGAELDAISACIIGGTSFFGGVGTVGGTLIGVLIIGVLRAGLNLLNVSADFQTIIIGAVIIGAVYVDVLRRRAGLAR